MVLNFKRINSQTERSSFWRSEWDGLANDELEVLKRAVLAGVVADADQLVGLDVEISVLNFILLANCQVGI